ncbi:Domain of uncharacterised function (DUF3173) [Streptococcus dysgalactiae subsp. dysgalactiae]|uniref:Domain of uncharacterized function (DUF3173) n=1 Tax=Streptococcus dysgalactiae subsp. dysgalactiae TaxID=99822 RepID=A0A380JUK8_STRDY|nr:DUF3173 domain-containing protein [Streptococcus dysgalactiae]SUN48770.1 Domain of uncharacterised function (DUF3173) [Streptococcus dysgalactiae subsp. dysgalactiae]
MTEKMIDKSHLMKMGFTKYQATEIIKQVKVILVNKGYSLYNNKRLSLVPASAVESVIGISIIEETYKDGNKNTTDH